MTRRLPLCAVCGCSLRLRDIRVCGDGVRVLCEYREAPGRPTVGWCPEHFRAADSLAHGDVEGFMREIDARGPGRVVRGRR